MKLAKSEEISKRRASLVLLTKPVRDTYDERLLKLALGNIDRVKGEKDILITKAVSWLLREMVKNYRKEVEEYLDANEDSLPKVAVRETKVKLKTGKKNKSKYRLGIIAMIVNKRGQFLLVQLKGKGKGDWNFPGGGLEEGESIEDCLWREMQEEVGLDKNSLTLIGKSKRVNRYKYNPELLKVKREQGIPYIGQEKHQFVLRFTGDETTIVLNEDEFTDYKWVEFDDLKKYLLFPGQYEKAVKVVEEILSGV